MYAGVDIDRVPIAEAARRLGLSTEAIRKRIKRGSLDAQKDEHGQWWVLLPPDTAGRDQDATSQRPDAGGDTVGQVDVLAVLQERIRQLEDERDYLRRVLADQTIAVQTMALRALPPPREPAGGAAETPRPWWQFWR